MKNTRSLNKKWEIESVKKVFFSLHRKKIRQKNIFTKKLKSRELNVTISQNKYCSGKKSQDSHEISHETINSRDLFFPQLFLPLN